MNFEYLFDILLIPVCIQVGALIIGFLLNRLINRYLHSNINQGSWQYIFVNALRGLPISWCSGVGLYWTINSLDIPPTVNKLLSYLLFAVIVFTLTRVVSRTLFRCHRLLYDAFRPEHAEDDAAQQCNQFCNLCYGRIDSIAVLRHFRRTYPDSFGGRRYGGGSGTSGYACQCFFRYAPYFVQADTSGRLCASQHR